MKNTWTLQNRWKGLGDPQNPQDPDIDSCLGTESGIKSTASLQGEGPLEIWEEDYKSSQSNRLKSHKLGKCPKPEWRHKKF